MEAPKCCLLFSPAEKNILNVCDIKLFFFLPSLKEFTNIFIYGNIHYLKVLVAELLKNIFH